MSGKALENLVDGQAFRDGDGILDAFARAQQFHDLAHGGIGFDFVFAVFQRVVADCRFGAVAKDARVGNDVAALQPVGDFDDAGAFAHFECGRLGEWARRFELDLAEIENGAGAEHHDDDERQHEVHEDDRLAAGAA
jgi:hypothetical protein